MERGAGVHLQQRGEQGDRHLQASNHQEEDPAYREAGPVRVPVSYYSIVIIVIIIVERLNSLN